jgi:Tol biopolymer transport system component
MAFNHIFSQDGQYIIYVNYDDGKKLYKTSIGDNLNGEPITVSAGLYPTLSPDGNNIVYTL